MHAGIQAEEGDEAPGAREAIDRSDRCQQPDSHNHVDPGDCHEPLRIGATQRVACEFAFRDPKILS
jgi:hypothetical protein